MNCSQCGSPIVEGSRFCQKCGAPVQELPNAPAQAPQTAPSPQPLNFQQPQQPPYQPYAQQPYAQQPYAQQPYGAPPYPGAFPPKKKKTGLIIGIIAGAVVLIGAALALYLFVFSGTSVTGQWYCEERGRVLVFSGEDTVTGYSLTGTVDGKYEYDKSKSEGTVTANGTALSFKVEKNELVLTDEQNDDESTFLKTDKGDTEELVLSALQGLWSSEEIGEVLEFDNGKINVYSGYGDFNGTYDYDIDKGQGTFNANGADFEFFADYNALSVTNTGNYVKAGKDLDIKAFVTEHAMPLLGMWYDASGTYGTIEFKNDGTASLIMFDQPLMAAYTFDMASGTGTFSTEATGQTSTMTYNDGTIEIDGISYTKDYVEQMGADDLQSSITGTWYEKTGTLGDITFYDDGSQLINFYGQSITGTYTFDPISGQGQITFDDNGTTTTWDFSVDRDALQIEDTTYTRDYVEPVSGSSIVGIWYDVTGQSGTVTFYEDSSVLFECYGTMLTGTYTFDDLAATGSVTISDPTDPYNGTITLDGDYLYFDSIQYTRDYVEQTDYPGQ